MSPLRRKHSKLGLLARQTPSRRTASWESHTETLLSGPLTVPAFRGLVSPPWETVGYSHRTRVASRHEMTFVATPAPKAAEVAMVDDFATLATSGNEASRVASAVATLKTQEYLDALWQAANA